MQKRLPVTDRFFADTYALIEMVGGNANYAPYKSTEIVTGECNIVELYYCLIRDFDEQTANVKIRPFLFAIVTLSWTALVSGMKLKLNHRKEKLSYVDCVGYALAKEHRIPFLTGDSKFENRENVSFVK